MPYIVNPNYSSAAETWAQANKAAIQAWLAAPAQAAIKEITFDYIRANVPAAAAKSDGEIAEVFRALGIRVVP